MLSSMPKHIVCAVRGGRESRNTVSRAIALALETGARLTFFHIMDAEFLESTTIGGPLSVVYQQLVEMGEFAMLILCDRAQHRGVAEVDYVVQEGNVHRQLRQLGAEEEEVDVIVMGRPIRSPGRNMFKADEFDAFVSELEQEGTVRVVQVTPDPDDVPGS